MRVGVNMLRIRPNWGGGEEIYLRRTIAALAERETPPEIVVFSDTESEAQSAQVTHVVVSGRKHLEAVLADTKIDAFYSSIHRMPSKCPVPFGVYVMELQTADRKSKRGLFKRSGVRTCQELCDKARAIVTPSEHLKRQMLERFGVPLDKSIVAPLGIDPVFAEDQDCIVEKPYILLVGNIHSNKNLPRFFEAFFRMADTMPHTVVMVGQPLNGELRDWGPRVIRVDRLPSAQLAGLYQHCDLFVCPSLYEGSGVTVLEAIKAGAPVAASRVGGIPEVAGEFVTFFDPENVDSIANTLRKCITEPGRDREARAKYGRQHAAGYTWEHCAEQTYKALRRIAS